MFHNLKLRAYMQTLIKISLNGNENYLLITIFFAIRDSPDDNI